MADIEMTPITRKEFYLAGITGMDVQAPSPVTRLESYLNDILNGTVSQLTPLNRVECYLAKISGADVRIPVPVTRLEFYLAAIAGEDIEVPDPVTREEHWLWQWANAGPGGLVETVTGTLPLTLANALSSAIVSLTRYGLCTQDGTPAPDAPVDIMCNNGALKWDSVNQRVYADGTPEVLTVGGPNLLNTATNITGYFINSSGVINKDSGTLSSQYTDLIPVEVGKKYTLSLISNRTKSSNNRVHGYDSNGNWVQEIIHAAPTIGSDVPFKLTTYTIQEGIVYVRISYGINDVEAMYEEGSDATDYQPYVAPQTASVPMLLSVGDVKDEVELIAGTYTHRCAACEYDGTQDVGETYLSTTGGKDVGAIIVYPLATPTTEHITVQNLVTNEGTNVVDSVANVSPLEAEVKYMAASAQDVLATLLGMRVTPKDISTQDAEDMINIITGEENK